MYIAKNSQGVIVESFRLTKKDQQTTFWCVKCGEALQLKKSKKDRWYFAHVRKKFSQGEGLEHKTGKAFFLQWGKNQGHQIVLEEVFAVEKRRGDIFLPLERKVLEFQCAKMSAEEIFQRQKDYEKGNFQLQWILGGNYREKKHFTQQQKNFFQYHPHLGFYYLYLNQKLYLIHHCLHQQGKSSFVKEEVNLQKNFLALWQAEKLVTYQKFSPLFFTNQQFYLQQLAYRKDLRFLKEQAFFYGVRKNLLALPADFYQLTSVTLPFMKGLGSSFQYELLSKLLGKKLLWEEFPLFFAEFLSYSSWYQALPLVSKSDCSRSYWQTYGKFFLKKNWCKQDKLRVEFSDNFSIY